jgi:hypothetical protein
MTYVCAVTLPCILFARHDSFVDQLLMTEFMPVMSHVSRQCSVYSRSGYNSTVFLQIRFTSVSDDSPQSNAHKRKHCDIFLTRLQRGLLGLIRTMAMFMVCSWSRNMFLAHMYSNTSVNDRTMASMWQLMRTFLWKRVNSTIQFTLNSQLASIQQLDKYFSPWFNKSVNTNNLGDSVLLRYGTASQKAFQDQSTTENEGTVFPQNTGIWLSTDTSQTTRTQISATLLQKPQNSPAIMFMSWYSGFIYSK